MIIHRSPGKPESKRSYGCRSCGTGPNHISLLFLRAHPRLWSITARSLARTIGFRKLIREPEGEFFRDPLVWNYAEDEIGTSLGKLYKRMAEIRKDYSVLRTGAFDPDYWDEWQTQFNSRGYGSDIKSQVAIYHRFGLDDSGELHYFVIVLNFSDIPQPVTVGFPENGIWTDLLSEYSGTWQPQIENNSLAFDIGPNWGHVFHKPSERD